MKIRNKLTGQVHEVLAGTLYAKNIFEEVTDEDIKVGEPTVEFEIEQNVNEDTQKVDKKSEDVKKTVKKAKKTKKKGVKKNGTSRK